MFHFPKIEDYTYLRFFCFRPGTDFKDVITGSHSLKLAMSSIRYKDFFFPNPKTNVFSLSFLGDLKFKYVAAAKVRTH